MNDGAKKQGSGPVVRELDPSPLSLSFYSLSEQAGLCVDQGLAWVWPTSWSAPLASSVYLGSATQPRCTPLPTISLSLLAGLAGTMASSVWRDRRKRRVT